MPNFDVEGWFLWKFIKSKGLGKQSFYIQLFNYGKCLFHFWYSLGSYQYSSKIIQWGAKEAGSFLLHRLFITREKWTIFFCQINILVWFTINRGQYIENRPGIMIFTRRNSVCPCPKWLNNNNNKY